MIESASDDVIRIRVDTTWAVLDFIRLLAAQAAEGETRAPANPAATAIFRELAPFRLVEYDYVDGGVGVVDRVLLGFPDGSLYPAADDVPESAVNALVSDFVGGRPELPPIYVYVVLAARVPSARLEDFLRALSDHVGQPVVGVHRGIDGRMTSQGYRSGLGDADAGALARVAHGAARGAEEGDRHPPKAEMMARFTAMCRRPDGRAVARMTYAFARHNLEFASEVERDDFVLWSTKLCIWLDTQEVDRSELGFANLVRPAEVAPVPAEGLAITRLIAPSAEVDDRRYWEYVKRQIDNTMAAEAMERT